LKAIYQATVLALATALLASGVSAAKLYKCVNENGKTTYKQTQCVNARQDKVLEYKSANGKRQAHNTKPPDNQENGGKYKTTLSKRLDAYGEKALERQKSSTEQAIKGGFAVAGMSKSEVQTAMGKPTSATGPDYSSGSASETWIYELPGKTEFVFFARGRVTSMSANLY
jgi:hypothetical protein